MNTSYRRWFVALAIVLLLSELALSELGAGQPGHSLAPVELVRLAVQTQEDASRDTARFMFLDRKQTPQGSSTKLMLETRDTLVGVTVARNDQPLGPAEQEKENADLMRLLKNPDKLRKQTQREKEDDERFSRVIRALPEAFLFEPSGEQPSTPGVGKAGDPLLRLRFKPNPNYAPPSQVEKVLTAVQGELLLDVPHSRIARITGTLFKGVNFGWGVLGHLDPGGSFLMEQGVVSEKHWDLTRMTLALTGKILVKRFEVQSDEVISAYTPLAENLTLSQSIAIIKKTQEDFSENKTHAGFDN